MFKKLFLTGFLLQFVFLSSSFAQTNVSGTISTNTTWNLAGSPYIVQGNVTVNPGITLTIDPDVDVKFDGNYTLTVNGTLNAIGQVGQEIEFLSNQASPAAGNWDKIHFNTNSSGTLDYVRIYHASTGVWIQNSSPTITNGLFDNNTEGIRVAEVSAPNITNNTFSNQTTNPVVIVHGVNGSNSPVLASNTYTNNGSNGIKMMSTQADGIFYDTTLTKDNTFYEVNSYMNIRHAVANQTGTVTINPGVEIRFGPGDGFTLTGGPTFGALNAVGTATEPIKFTSLAQTGTPGSWRGIRFTATTAVSLTHLDHVIVEDAGEGTDNAIFFDFVPGSIPITNSVISNNLNSGLYIKGIYSGNITGNTFSNNGGYPIVIEHTTFGSNSPVLQNNTYTNNGSNGIRIKPAVSGVVAIFHDTTLTKDGTYYETLENISVRHAIAGLTAKLTIQPGVEIRFAPGTGLDLLNPSGSSFGALDAQGTALEPIVFTSNAVTPAAGDWKGLSFPSTTIGNETFLDHVTVEYAGSGGSPAIFMENIADPFFLNNSAINNNSSTGIQIRNSSVEMINNTVSNNTVGIFIEGAFNADVMNNTVSNNSGYAVMLKHNNIAGTDSNLVNNTYTNNNPDLIKVTTEVGSIYRDSTFTKDTIDYEITDYTRIQYGMTGENTTVNIDPGVVIRFGPGAALEVGATLNATGTAADPILFTSNQSVKMKGDWIGLLFNQFALGNLTKLDNVHVEYAGEGPSPAVRIENVPEPMTITRSVIEKSLGDGIYIKNSSPGVTQNMITDNANGISLDTTTSAVITDNTVTLNTNGVFLNGPGPGAYPTAQISTNALENNMSYNLVANAGSSSITVNAANNWWGTTSPAAISAAIFDNGDDPARPVVNFTPFLNASLASNPVSGVSVSQIFFDPYASQSASINYTLSANSTITVKIYDFNTGTLVRTLVNTISRTAGPHSEIWNGDDDSLQTLPQGVYYFVIEAFDPSGGQLAGLYNPGYTPVSAAISNAALGPLEFDAYKGEVATVNYTLTDDALVKIDVGTTAASVATLIDDQPKTNSSHSQIWDGRNNSGAILTPAAYIAVIFAKKLPQNALVIQSSLTVSIDDLKADPFIFHPVYSDVTRIDYTISGESALVTIAVENSSGTPVATIINNQLTSTGNHSVEWNGKDGISAGSSTVSGSGNFVIKVTAVGQTTGAVVERKGNITVF